MNEKNKKVFVNDKTQQYYTYSLTEPDGRNFDTRFKPDLSPKQVFALSVYGVFRV